MAEYTIEQRAALQVLEHAASHLMKDGRDFVPEGVSPASILMDKRREIYLESFEFACGGEIPAGTFYIVGEKVSCCALPGFKITQAVAWAPGTSVIITKGSSVRRNLGVALLNELDQQKYGKGL
jgi:hypothetical protein